MYLSIEEEYFSVELTPILRIALMNNTPPEKSILMILHIFLNIVFSLVFKHRTDWCLVSGLLYPLVVCLQIIAL